MTVARRRASAPRVHAVELHEPDRLFAALLVRRAVPQPTANERQVRVGVARLRGPLLIRELGPEVQLVVGIAGVGGKELLEHLQVVLDFLAVVLEDRRDAPVEVARRRVVRDVARLGVPREVGAELLVQPAPDVEEVEARCRLDAQRGVERIPSRVDVAAHEAHRAALERPRPTALSRRVVVSSSHVPVDAPRVSDRGDPFRTPTQASGLRSSQRVASSDRHVVDVSRYSAPSPVDVIRSITARSRPASIGGTAVTASPRSCIAAIA